MSKFNKSVKTGTTSPVKTTGTRTLNAEDKLAFERDKKSELFLLAVSNFVGQDTFYENAKNRDDRFVTLCRDIAVSDPNWYAGFVGWLRNDAFMRSAAVVAGVEGAKALWDSGAMNGVPRALVAASMARADEPGEVLAYYVSKYGKNFPAFLKKGVADGARKLYNEYSLMKYDTDSKGYRFTDVIQLVHVKPKDSQQSDLFQFALDRRYGNAVSVPRSLTQVNARAELMNMPVTSRKALIRNSEAKTILKNAGMTWEALSGWLQGPMDAAAWEAVIPSMGYMALLRNLRNFVDAGVSAIVLKRVLAKISDPEQVANSKQFPFRFLAAYQANKDNLKIAAALEEALEASLSNVPELSGRTLILVDRSGSMFSYHRTDSELTMADKAAIFGSALALRAEAADLVEFGTTSRPVSFRKGASLMPILDKFRGLGGTDTSAAVKGNYRNHDRVIIITDEQFNGWGGDPLALVPANVPCYTWNLEGYKTAHGKSGSNKRHTFGGLTDKSFAMIPLIESGQSQNWPWQK